ncbi:MAG: hypothetical protein CHACPFDD_04029 [Phycisphaerae bacterium]|nr:hypothetical protein [Phycisphaerae bacterium]
MKRALFRVATALALAPVAAALAQDWNNIGGNNARNGQSPWNGPTSAADLIWNNTADPSIIAWAPFTLGDRVFSVREAGFPQNGGAANDAIVCYDIDTGSVHWRKTLPFGGNTATEWIAWILGVRDGRVYASRSAQGTPAIVRALDVTTGNPLWQSTVVTQAFAYDGVVFAPDGDLIIGDFQNLWRLDSVTGNQVWHLSRSSSVSGNSGGAATANAVFIEQVAGGGQIITKVDIATGTALYNSPVMPGFTEQNSCFLSPDGSVVYFSRTQNNVAVDFLYAFQDTGAALVELWHVPVRWTTSHSAGIGLDGSIYTFTQADEFVRLDPATGAITANAGALAPLGSPNLSAYTAVDAEGRVYVSNGWASNPANSGRVWAFNADLSANLFTLTLSRPNQGGPAIGLDHTLIMCDLNAVRAYRGAPPCLPCDANCDGSVNGFDVDDFVALLDGSGTPCSPCAGDMDADGSVNGFDIDGFVDALTAGGC